MDGGAVANLDDIVMIYDGWATGRLWKLLPQEFLEMLLAQA